MTEFSWSDEQLDYFKALQVAINSDSPQLLKISAVAGASKSSSTVEAVKRVHRENPKLSIRYLVFNTAMAAEAKTAFGHTAIASTLHALAYYYTVKPYRLNPDIAPWLTWKDIPQNIKVPYGSLPLILQTLTNYFESGYTDFPSFISNEVDNPEWTMTVYMAANLILDAMATGKMRITHAFYLKLFHILVKLGQIKLKPEDILIVDECQDLNLITLDIFHAYPAKVKVIIGDQAQSIYSFMGCVSAFDFYKNQGTTYHLSTSFRVSTHIAQTVEQFCKLHISEDMNFKGIDYPKEDIKTHAHIFRTNLSMIRQMIRFNKARVPYKLVTKQKVKQLFELPLALIYATPGHTQFSENLKVIQHTIDQWGKLPEHSRPNKLVYLSEQLKEVPAIDQAIKFIMAVGAPEVVEAYQHAEEHMKTHSNTYLMTAHTSKGLTFDEATLDDSMNEAIKDILNVPVEERTAEAQSEIFLYYVACSRARFKLNNADYLPKQGVDYFKERARVNDYTLDPMFNRTVDEELDEFFDQINRNEEVEI